MKTITPEYNLSNEKPLRSKNPDPGSGVANMIVRNTIGGGGEGGGLVRGRNNDGLVMG